MAKAKFGFFKWFFAGLVGVLLTILIGGYIFIKTFDVKKYKPRIIEMASRVLARKVELGDIRFNVSLKRGLYLSLSDFVIQDDPSFSSLPFFRVKEVSADLDIFTLIKAHSLAITDIIIKEPRVNIVRDKSGRLNLQTIGKPNRPATPEPVNPLPQQKPEGIAAGLPAVFIGSIRLQNAGVEFFDQSFEPQLKASLGQIDITVDGFSLTDKFNVSIEAAVFSDTQDLQVNSMCKLDLKRSALDISDTAISFDLNKLNLAYIKKITPLKNTLMPETFSGRLGLKIKNLTASSQGLGAFAADIFYTDGLIYFSDVVPGISLRAEKIDMKIKDFSLDGKPFVFDAKLACFSQVQDISVSSMISFDPAAKTFSFKDTSWDIDLEKLSLDQLKTGIVSFKNTWMPKSLKGGLNISLKDFVCGAGGLTGISGRLKLSQGTVVLKELAVPIDGIEAAADFDQSDISSLSIKAGLSGGTIDVQSSIKDYLKVQDLQAKIKISNLQLAGLIDQQKAQVKAEGAASLDLQVSGKLSEQDTLVGKGQLDIEKVYLRGFNVLKAILDKISFLPNAGDNVQAKLTPAYQDELKSPDTAIKKIYAEISLADKKLNVDPLQVEADDFIFKGKSDSGFDLKYDITGTVQIPADLSNAMAAGLSGMKYLYDDKNQITIPVYAAGEGAKAPAIEVTKTTLDMTKKIAQNVVKEQLGKALLKAAGISSGGDSSTQDQGGDNSGGANTGQVVDSIFGLFKK